MPITTILDYDFMRTAFAAGTVVAVLAGPVGYLLVLRGQTFAGHAMSHIGFAGATGAALLGIAPLWGMLAFTLAGGVAMGMLGERARGADVTTGIVLAFSLGLGVLFLRFYTGHATQATTLLFGNVLAVTHHTVWVLAALGVAGLGALALIARPLVFATLQPAIAEARGVRLRLVGALFLGVAALAVAAATQVVGILLVFALLVGPAAAAGRITTDLASGVVLSVALALAVTWAGLALAWVTDWPPTFWITTLGTLAWLVSPALARRARDS